MTADVVPAGNARERSHEWPPSSGPGGLSEFLVHLGPALVALWSQLGAPSLDDPTTELLGAQAAHFDGTVAELAQRRDEAQIRLLRALGGLRPMRRRARERALHGGGWSTYGHASRVPGTAVHDFAQGNHAHRLLEFAVREGLDSGPGRRGVPAASRPSGGRRW